jgi:hypothetical protein
LTTWTATETPTPLALPSVSCFATADGRVRQVRGRAQRQVRAVQRTGSGALDVGGRVRDDDVDRRSSLRTPTLLPPAPEIELAM